MLTTCVVCNVTSSGMISIFEHPNNLDFMLNSVSGHEICVEDYLCIMCYDELKIAFNFKQKCTQSKLYRASLVDGDGDADISVLNEEQQDDQKLKTVAGEAKASSQEIAVDDGPKPSTCTKITPTSDSESQTHGLEEMIVEIPMLTPDETITTTTADIQDENVLEAILIGVLEKENVNQKSVTDVEKLGKYEEYKLLSDSDDAKMEILDSDGSLNCSKCKKSFSGAKELKKHDESCNDRDMRERLPRDQHRRGPIPQYTKDDAFQYLGVTQCEYCFEMATSEEALKVHETKHKTEERPYRCFFNECNRRFMDRYSFRIHLRTHSDNKPYQCQFCHQSFAQQGNMKTHERYHTGEKPYKCQHCSKAFAEKGNLNSHIRFHTGERRYECNFCDKRFRTHYSHKIHERSHTQEKPFQCSSCGKTFNCSGKLRIHTRIHTGQRPYICFVCSASFMDNSRLKRHMRTHPTKQNDHNVVALSVD